MSRKSAAVTMPSENRSSWINDSWGSEKGGARTPKFANPGRKLKGAQGVPSRKANEKPSLERRAKRSWYWCMTRRAVRSLSSPERKASRSARCPVCRTGVLLPVDDIASEIEGYTFVERGFRCSACGEEFLPEEESQRMIRIAS